MADPAPTPVSKAAIAERSLAMLGDLAEVGLRLTLALERHVVAAEKAHAHVAETDPDAMILAAVDFAGVATAYNRISRAVRMTLALQARLANPRWCRAEPEIRGPAPGVSNRSPSDDDDRPLHEETRENLFDTPDIEVLLDQPARDPLLNPAHPLGELSGLLSASRAEGAGAGRSGQQTFKTSPPFSSSRTNHPP